MYIHVHVRCIHVLCSCFIDLSWILRNFKNCYRACTGQQSHMQALIMPQCLCFPTISSPVFTFLTLVLQLQSSIRDTLRRMSSQRLLSAECVRLFLVLPAFILKPPNTELCAVFASSLTSLAAEWRALVGEWCDG